VDECFAEVVSSSTCVFYSSLKRFTKGSGNGFSVLLEIKKGGDWIVYVLGAYGFFM